MKEVVVQTTVTLESKKKKSNPFRTENSIPQMRMHLGAEVTILQDLHRFPPVMSALTISSDQLSEPELR